jgi:hypothetical protein
MGNTKSKGLKLKLTLHQPKKWEKHNWVTQSDIDAYENIIYNDLNLYRALDKDIPKVDTPFLDMVLVEDETYAILPDNLDNYCITTYGRVINLNRKKLVQPTIHVNSMYTFLKGKNISFKTVFNELGWIYSPSFIKEKYKEYGWKAYTNKQK